MAKNEYGEPWDEYRCVTCSSCGRVIGRYHYLFVPRVGLKCEVCINADSIASAIAIAERLGKGASDGK